MTRQDEIVDALASFALFSDLSTPQLYEVAETFSEAVFQAGQPVLRQGLKGSNFFIILEGEAAVEVDGVRRTTLGRGEFFGEVAILLGEVPTADVVATGQLRCLVLAPDDVPGFLTRYPRMTYRMLQAEARRVRNANRWRS